MHDAIGLSCQCDHQGKQVDWKVGPRGRFDLGKQIRRVRLLNTKGLVDWTYSSVSIVMDLDAQFSEAPSDKIKVLGRGIADFYIAARYGA